MVPTEISLEQLPEPPECALHATPNWDRASRYSSWPQLLRITAYLYRFLNRLRRSKNPLMTIATLLPEEIQNAKRYWLKTMQSDMFPNEIVALNQKPKARYRRAARSLFSILIWTRPNLFIFEEDSVELASQERRRIPLYYAHIRCWYSYPASSS
ncbi:hypothetical protein ALC57_15733 [Trachymyrmex cornetzi]|uniref:Uncharacterized protein n=1 Tax=Trachymyrmex cornetzi TaxID=471704 RepID=A0A151IW98_9HYME|nr:hypothetical protein ALC57_15733 [Trachymyrmex cornetzi]